MPDVTEKTSLAHSIEDDRRLYIQAVMVRILKARKCVTHTQLIQETIEQTKDRFTPQIPVIKRCIEVLIERHYIERDIEKKDSYLYVT
jgi:hypothetical protein